MVNEVLIVVVHVVASKVVAKLPLFFFLGHNQRCLIKLPLFPPSIVRLCILYILILLKQLF